MCFWGASLALGPNYNVPMLPDRARAAWDALQRARALAPARDARRAGADRGAVASLQGSRASRPRGDAPAQRRLRGRDAGGRRPVPRRPRRAGARRRSEDGRQPVEAVVARRQARAGDRGDRRDARARPRARADCTPARTTTTSMPSRRRRIRSGRCPSAERLAALMPGAGHIVHMPAHIFQRVGRYADASEANAKAVAGGPRVHGAREAHRAITRCTSGTTTASSPSRRRWRAAAPSRSWPRARRRRRMPPGMLDMMPGMDFFVSEPLLAMVRFGAWDELLAEPRPDPKYPVLTALWLHGHGMALAAKGKLADARRDLEELVALGAKHARRPAGEPEQGDATCSRSRRRSSRRGSRRSRRSPDASRCGPRRSRSTTSLAYAEPDDWFYPVRHYQAAALLDAGKPARGGGGVPRGSASGIRTTAGRSSACGSRSPRRRSPRPTWPRRRRPSTRRGRGPTSS